MISATLSPPRHRNPKDVVDRLVTQNRGLVRLMMKPLLRQAERMRIEPEDLEQEGTFGLMMAAERFDPSRGFRFATLACRCMEALLAKLATRPIAPAGIAR